MLRTVAGLWETPRIIGVSRNPRTMSFDAVQQSFGEGSKLVDWMAMVMRHRVRGLCSIDDCLGVYDSYFYSIQAELVLGTIARREKKDEDSDGDYLEDRVSFSEDKLMDSNCKAVMMAWEHPLMEAHAKAVCSGGGHVLNIGFGMGLVDTATQKYSPASHTKPSLRLTRRFISV
ncbi:hypothetical protein ACFX15_016164 [Malus domestica]